MRVATTVTRYEDASPLGSVEISDIGKLDRGLQTY